MQKSEIIAVVWNSVLKNADEFRITVKGTSMLPVLKENDEVIIKKISLQRLRKGDIIAYRQHETHILHRFLYNKKDLYILKGDNNKFKDKPIQGNSILGKVIFRIRNGKKTNFTSGYRRIRGFLKVGVDLVAGIF